MSGGKRWRWINMVKERNQREFGGGRERERDEGLKVRR